MVASQQEAVEMMFAYIEAAEADGSRHVRIEAPDWFRSSRKRVVFPWLPRCPHSVSAIKTIMTNLSLLCSEIIPNFQILPLIKT